jgi:hypothetical protein
MSETELRKWCAELTSRFKERYVSRFSLSLSSHLCCLVIHIHLRSVGLKILPIYRQTLL